MNAEQYLQKIRLNYPVLDTKLLDEVRIEGLEETSDEIAKRTKFRQTVVDNLRHNLRESDLPFLRFLLQQEIVCEENWDMSGCRSEYLETVAKMVVYWGKLEDIPLLWEVKHAGFDSSFVIDAAYFFVGGFAESIEYVKSLKNDERDEILEYLVDSVDFVKDWFDSWYRELRSCFNSDDN